MPDWGKEFKEQPMRSIGSIGTAIGACMAAFGVFFASSNLQHTQQAVQAATLYNVQKDARALFSGLDPEVMAYLYEPAKNQQHSPQLLQKAEQQLTTIVQFYSSVFNQHQDGIMSDKHWNSFQDEICSFLSLPHVKEFWEKRVAPGHYNSEFKDFGNKCINQTSPSTGA
jgi:hypothetical protein